MARVLAAVDVGSNTVHMLVAEAFSNGIRKIADQNAWLGLGEVVGRTKQIPLQLQDELIRVLGNYRDQAAYERAEKLYVFATEAVRVAKNGQAVLDRIEGETGLQIDLVDGNREAELGVRGVSIDCREYKDFTFIEVGGGSAQIATVTGRKVTKDVSLPLGSGALTARYALHLPCEPDEVAELVSGVEKEVIKALPKKRPDAVIACGGVARGIWRALHPDGDRMIHRTELDYLIWTVQRLDVPAICSRFSVKRQRAATLLPGAVVFREFLKAHGQDRLLISQYGLREGAILETADGGLEAWPP